MSQAQEADCKNGVCHIPKQDDPSKDHPEDHQGDEPNTTDDLPPSYDDATGPRIERVKLNPHAGRNTILFRLKIEDGNGNKVPVYELVTENKMIGFYFGASWCPPCQQFSPVLCDFLEKNRSEFSVVHVSLDHSANEYRSYVRDKPWYNVPYDEPVRTELTELFSVSLLPTLVIYDPARDYVVTSFWGRMAITRNPDHCIEEWRRGQTGVSWLQLLKFW
ncbi:uncharacterized protein VTP21DRAFT_2736 [Calcarisporiella thermophila]|uniref:uncharacterized protein n=1 Tax=Calcarisporiella thermophila TaxID=911321 RepID=UPI0037439A8B